MTNLSVVFSFRNVVRSSSYHHAITRCNRLHLIVFACICQELSRNQCLEYMSIELRSDIVSLPFFIFRNIICILQITDKFRNLRLLFNCIIFLCLCPQTVCQKLITEINPDVDLLNITMLVDQRFQRFKRSIYVKFNTADHQCLCNLIFTDLFSGHPHQKLQYRITFRACVISYNRRNCLRIRKKCLCIFKHIITKKIILANHIDKSLLFCPCCVQTHHLKQIQELIFYNQKGILLCLRTPEIRIYLKGFVKALLTHGKVCVSTDFFIILSRDPFHIQYRKLLTADPSCIGDLVFHSHCIDLCSDTHIPGYIGKDSVMHIFTICIPAHNRSNGSALARRLHLRNIGPQGM